MHSAINNKQLHCILYGGKHCISDANSCLYQDGAATESTNYNFPSLNFFIDKTNMFYIPNTAGRVSVYILSVKRGHRSLYYGQANDDSILLHHAYRYTYTYSILYIIINKQE